MRLFAQTAPPETPSSCAAIFLADRGNVTVEMYDISLPGLYTGFQASVRVHRIGVDEDAWNWLDRFPISPLILNRALLLGILSIWCGLGEPV